MENLNNNLCFCVHGSGQMIVNPQVREALSLPEIDEALSLAQQVQKIKTSLTETTWNKGSWFKGDRRCATATATAGRGDRRCAAASSTAAQFIKNNNLISVWINRPDWVKTDYIYNGKNYGKRELHFLLGMFGITTSFNDAKETTLVMLHAKLDEVLNFAKENSL